MQNRLTLLALALLVLTAGCNKLTKENYDKLKVGMAYDEVTKILGKADNCAAALGANNCTWGNEAKNITVIFVADKAMVFSHQGVK